MYVGTYVRTYVCMYVFFLKKLQDARNLIYKETPSHAFSCEFLKIFRGNFAAGHLGKATSKCFLFHDFSEKKT